MRRTSPVLVLAATAALGAAAALASIQSVSARQLSPGATTDVAGSAFARPVQAWLELGSRRIPLRVARGATDTAFTAKLASIPAGAHGDCVLRVRGQGTKIPFTFAGITVELPASASVTPLTARAGTEITIDGAFFGAKKGRVRVGGRAARVTGWTDTQIRAVVPSGVPGGDAFVDVQSKAGASASRPILHVE